MVGLGRSLNKVSKLESKLKSKSGGFMNWMTNPNHIVRNAYMGAILLGISAMMAGYTLHVWTMLAIMIIGGIFLLRVVQIGLRQEDFSPEFVENEPKPAKLVKNYRYVSERYRF